MLFSLNLVNAQECEPCIGILDPAGASFTVSGNNPLRPFCSSFNLSSGAVTNTESCARTYLFKITFQSTDSPSSLYPVQTIFDEAGYAGSVLMISETYAISPSTRTMVFSVTIPALTTTTVNFPFTIGANGNTTPLASWTITMTQDVLNDSNVACGFSSPFISATANWDFPYTIIKGTKTITELLSGPNPVLFPLVPGQFASINILLVPENGSIVPPTLIIDANYSIGASDSLFPNIFSLSPGATIKVLSGATLGIRSITTTTCSQLAQGFVIESGGRLNLTTSDIKDCRFGIDVKPGAIISVTNTLFTSNYIGARFNMNAAPFSATINAFTGNSFLSAFIPLKMPFPGMPEAVESRGYCGILASNYINFNIFGTPGNSFRSLANGLLLTNTTGNIANMFFNDMNSIGPAAYNFEGFGIRMFGKGKPSYMNINEFWHTMTFTNCKTGIRADYYHGDVENVTMTNVGIGIDWVNSPGRLIKLDGNTINARQEGIRSFMNEPTMAASLIRANTITMTTASPAALNPRTGIELQEGGLGGNLGGGWRVLGNTITMTNGGQGILYHNGLFGNIVGNVVNNTGASANSQNPYIGIETEANMHSNVAANTVNQSLPAGLGQGDSEGIYSASGFANTYQCNCVNRTAVGMQFNDMADFTNAVRGNRMNIHNTLGLQLGFPGGGAYVGRQDHTGNLWDLTAIPVGGFGGRNWGNALQSLFIVNPGAEHPAVAPVQWFDAVSGQSFTCSNACSFPPGAQIPPRVPEDYVPTGLDGASVNGTLGTGGYYPSETLWKGKYRLYRKMLRIPAIENYSSQYTAFKSANMYLPLGKLAYISEEKAKLYTLSSTEQSTLDAYWADLTSKISVLRNLDSLRQSGASVDPGVYNTAIQQHITSGTQYETYQQGLTTARQQKIQTLLTFNAGTSTGPTIEANHKTVNQIVLQMLLVDSLASGNLSTLTAIAAQCPLSGGDAVYEARSIVSRLTGQEYDDVALCGSQRPGAGGRAETSEIPAEVLVFPNPTTGYVSWLGIPEGKITVRVFNTLGQLQLESISENNAIDLSALNQGVYRFQILSAEQKILFNGSISLLK